MSSTFKTLFYCIRPSKYVFFIPFAYLSFVRMEKIEKRKQAWMRKHYELWQQSGLNQTQYCKENHIVLRQFKYWIDKFKSDIGKYSEDGEPDKETLSGRFISTIPSKVLIGASVKLTYPNGVELTGEFDLEQLRTLINL
ncbi:MAG: IS66 family insertion sequence element accessory protein TnpA [Mangrovibacterium sp.]